MSQSRSATSIMEFDSYPINKLGSEKISNLEALLSDIRISPATILDSKMIEHIKDNQHKLYNSESIGEFKTFQTSYGISSKQIGKINESVLYSNVGENYGQDYVFSGNNYISLADGHGSDGERYATYAGIYLPNYINSSLVEDYLAKQNFSLVKTIFKNAFQNIESNLTELYTSSKYNTHKHNILEHIINNCGISPEGGTTYNYTSLHCVDTCNDMKKRYIVHANIGDSETFAVFRYPDGKISIKQLSTTHSVENIQEAQNIIDKHSNNIDKVRPIYSRFNSRDYLGLIKCPLPEHVVPHIDHVSNTRELSIYTIDSSKKIKVNLETLHKLNMGLGAYGKVYNIHDWYGGIQGLRTDVIEKKIDGKWVGIAPIPLGNPENFGSTPNGMTQSTRSFGDTIHGYISAVPCINILEVPSEVHVTIISQSDGYGDILHLSDIASAIGEITYGAHNMCDSIKDKMIKLMYDKIKGNEMKGFSVNHNNQPIWDDVCFGIIDSPPMV